MMRTRAQIVGALTAAWSSQDEAEAAVRALEARSVRLAVKYGEVLDRPAADAARALVKAWDEHGCGTCGGTGVAFDWPDAVALREALSTPSPSESGS